jgi:hypothetical protein
MYNTEYTISTFLARTASTAGTLPYTCRKVHTRTGGLEVYLYSFFNPVARWSTPRSCRSLHSGKTRYPLYRWLGGPQGRFGRVRKTSLPPGFDPRTIQPVASRYTD